MYGIFVTKQYMFLNCFMEDFFLEILGYVYEIHGENKECTYSNECN